MIRVVHIITAAALLLMVSGCGGAASGSAPFEASTTQTVHSGGMPPIAWTVNHIVISSRVDKLRITGVTANRGNCKIENPEDVPASLAFGEQLDIKVGDCSVAEAIVSTDQGEWPMTFSEQ